MKITRKLLLIFIKNPVLGKVKTRLARTLGDAKALDVYLQLLNHTLLVTKDVAADKAVFYTDFVDRQDMWPDDLYQKQLQQGQDLGQRMQGAFEWAFEKQYGQVVIIGSDCPQLTTAIIEQAFAQLDTSKVVLGPAADGGYYLLGMTTLVPRLFNNKNWSTVTVLSDTLADLQILQLSYSTLPTLHDVDHAEDLPLLHLTTAYTK
jgi:rSAM/selenodomain-associated transferase 1